MVSQQRGVKTQDVTTQVPTPQEITTQYFTTEGVISRGGHTKRCQNTGLHNTWYRTTG